MVTSTNGNRNVNTTSYVGQMNGQADKTVVFALKDKIGALAKVLKLFQDSEDSDSKPIIDKLRCETSYLEVISRDKAGDEESEMPWFPQRKRDLDKITDNVLECGSELKADHPGFKDQEYRTRRKYFADLAKRYRHGQPIPRVEYSKREIDTWRVIYDRVVPLYERFACKEFNHIWPLMEENCGYSRDNIPQLEDVSNFLRDSTGFSLRPVAGLLSSRDFLAGLAHRVFHSTQYIRHHANPDYTPEPDICHELLGHAPLFADPDFARFSQEIGLASLGAPEEYIVKLATCYWFTIEFGLCKQDGQMKAYGAGLLSSFGELEYAMSGKPQILPFDPMVTGDQKYPITEYQPTYFLAESFADAQSRLHDYAMSIPRPSVFRYNPYTESVETLDSKTQICSVVKELKEELALIEDGLRCETSLAAA